MTVPPWGNVKAFKLLAHQSTTEQKAIPFSTETFLMQCGATKKMRCTVFKRFVSVEEKFGEVFLKDLFRKQVSQRMRRKNPHTKLRVDSNLR